MTGRTTIRQRASVAGVVGFALVLAACSGGDGGDDAGDDGSLTVWTPHNTPSRITVQEEVAAEFEEETGVSVNIVGMDAEDMNQSAVAGAAAGDLPDVALIGPDQVASWESEGLLDTEAAQQSLDELDPSTFSEESLELIDVGGETGAVPSDGWGELLYYRTDVFEEFGLQPPETVADVGDAAQAIDDSDAGMSGIVLGTKPADRMAHENLEHFGLANGCQMFDDSGIAIDSEQCVETLSEYQDMIQASVSGDQDVESTRSAYLAGDAAMVVWSPHLLDEIANLEPNFPVSAEGVEDNDQFLADNTGVVGGLTGVANDEATGYGLTMNLGILQGANTEAAQQYVDYVLSEGYLDTLAMTTEGRVPVRTGTSEEPETYVEEWQDLEIGVEEGDSMPFTEAYSQDVVDEVVDAANSFTRWGFGTEHWATAGAAITQNELVENVGTLVEGGDPEAYAEQMAETVSTLQQENE